MVFKETVITQFDPWLEAQALSRSLNPHVTLENLIHTFAEFSCHVPLVSYQYQQVGQELFSPGLESQGDVLNMIKTDSRRSYQEYQGFAKFREKILDANGPSFGLWVSPPGPKSEGYGDYGYFYIALIPQPNEKRIIQMLALRIENFDANSALQSLGLLELLGLEAGIKPASNHTETLLLNPIVFPVGRDQKISTIQEFLTLVSLCLSRNFSQEDINDGLVGRTLKKVYRKFRSQIHQVFTQIWLASKGLSSKFNSRKLFSSLPPEIFSGGSCPSASETSTTNSTNNKEIHWCPQCGMFFYGNQCGCGYKI